MFLGTVVPLGLFVPGSPQVVEYLAGLSRDRIQLAESRISGARAQADAIALVQQDICNYHIRKLHIIRKLYFGWVGTDHAAACKQIAVIDGIVKQIHEISLFWDVFSSIPGTLDTQSDSSSSCDSVFSNSPNASRKTEQATGEVRPDPVYTSTLFANAPEQGSVQLPMHPSLRRYWQLQDQFSQTKTEFNDAVSQRSRTPAHESRQIQDKDAEIEGLTARLAALQSQMDQLKAELHNKNIQLQQQAATIQIHSEEMSKHHNRPQTHESHPFQLPSQIANVPQGYHQAQSTASSSKPKQLELPGYAQDTSHYQHGFPQQYGGPPSYGSYNQNYQPLPAVPAFGPTSPGTLSTKWGNVNYGPPSQGHQAVAAYGDTFRTPQDQGRVVATSRGSPMPVDQMRALSITERSMTGGGNGLLNTPPRQQQEVMGHKNSQGNTSSTSHSSDAYMVVPRVPNHSPAASASQVSSSNSKTGALVPHAGDLKEVKMTSSFQGLLDEVMAFAHRHVNVPSTQGDNNVPAFLKTHLLALASTTTASRILSNRNTRYFLIAKLILDWIMNNVFGESKFAGFDANVDGAVRATREKIFGDTPAAVRKVLLQEIARQFTKFKNNMEFEQYMSQLNYKRSTDLWNMVRYLIYVKSDGDWNELHSLVLNAHKLALAMLSEETEFRFEFSRTGSLFNEINMVNMDPQFRQMPSHAIMAAGGLVQLGALPQVLIRLTAANGETTVKTLIKAGVLITFPTTK